MPYKKGERPGNMPAEMPDHAVEIYVAAFNSAFAEHKDEKKAHAIAWAAVKKAGYAKKDGKWQKVSEAMSMEVERTYKPVKIGEACDLSEAVFDTDARVIKNAILLRAGESRNRNLHQAHVMKRDMAIFEGAPAFSGHVRLAKDAFPASDPRNAVGIIRNVVYNEVDSTGRGDLHYFADYEAQIAKAREAADAGARDMFGMSIWADAQGRITRHNGRLTRVIEAYRKGPETSVDFVVGPSAGGRLFEAIAQEDELMGLETLSIEELKVARPDLVATLVAEAEVKPPDPPKAPESPPEPVKVAEAISAGKVEQADKNGDEALHRIQVLEARITLDRELGVANLPPVMATKVRERFDGRIFEAAELQKEIGDYKDMAAKIHESQNLIRDHIQIVTEPADKLQIALDKLFSVHEGEDHGIKSFRGVQEAYLAYTGDVDMTGYVKISEALTSASLPYALANSMTKRLIKDYRATDYGWRKFCSIDTAQDFKTQERVRVGYLPDLEAVDPEAANYLNIADYTDEKATFTIQQYGNILGFSRKFWINDDLNTLSKVLGRLGRAAARTQARRVYVTWLANNATYTVDSKVFFHADHGNLGSTALSAAAVNATRILMAKFTEPDSGERLGMQLRKGNCLLIVPVDLEETAIQINQYRPTEAQPNTCLHLFGAEDENIIACSLLTDATDWYLGVMPEEIDWLTMSFLQGRQEPEFWLQDNPIVGDVFMADKMTYKIRHEYEVGGLDFRGAYKHVVAA